MTEPNFWQWQTWQGSPYLTCELLQPWQHGFFTQDYYPQTPETLVTVLAPDASVFRVKQVHGNTVLTPTEITQRMPKEDTDEKFPPADGVISDGPRQSVWTASADCTPALIGDTVTGAVAAIHAGWRGTAQRILPKAVERFLAQGSRLENVRIALGPAIAGDVYQVHRAVAVEVGHSLDGLVEGLTEARLIETLSEMPNSPLLPDPDPKKVRLDVRRINALQLEDLGISSSQMAIAPYCTYQNPDRFFSYRRTHAKKVQWSGIVSNLV